MINSERCEVCGKILKRKNKIKVCYKCGDTRVYDLIKQGYKITK